MVKYLKNMWDHRVFISFALSETGNVRGARVRAVWFLCGGLLLVSSFAALALIGDIGRARVAATLSGSKELRSYVDKIADLEDNKKFNEQKLQVIAQEMGVLQSRLDRFDSLGQKLVADEGMADLLEGVELETGQGGVLLNGADTFDDGHGHSHGDEYSHEDEGAALEQPSVEQIQAYLHKLRAKADRTEAALETGLALAMLNKEDTSIIPHFWPVIDTRMRKSSSYGWRVDPIRKRRSWHSGTDIAAGNGAAVVSAADGVVIYAGYRYGFGILVEVQHANGFTTRYAHLNEHTVKNGDRVAAGDLVGLMGSTGRSTGPHLHFEISKGNQKLDPYPFIKDSRKYVAKLAQSGRGEELLAQWKEKKRLQQLAAKQ